VAHPRWKGRHAAEQLCSFTSVVPLETSVGIESISGSRFESDSNPAETTTWMIHPEESARRNDPVGSMEGVGHALFHGPTIHLHGLSVFTTKFEALALQKA